VKKALNWDDIHPYREKVVLEPSSPDSNVFSVYARGLGFAESQIPDWMKKPMSMIPMIRFPMKQIVTLPSLASLQP
jgi:hypothetical protein